MFTVEDIYGEHLKAGLRDIRCMRQQVKVPFAFFADGSYDKQHAPQQCKEFMQVVIKPIMKQYESEMFPSSGAIEFDL